MNAWTAISACLISYLLGSIPFGYAVARARGVDIRTVGSGNIGATNVFRVLGKGPGILTFACDVLKGFAAAFGLPLAAAQWTDMSDRTVLSLLCMICVVAGHNWPVFLRFRGGKGIATSTGALLGLAPAAMLIGLAVWLVLFLTVRIVSIASMAAAAAAAAAAWILQATVADSNVLLPVALSLLAGIAVWRHKSNIQRLLNGTENRVEFGKKPGRGTEPERS